MQNNAKFLKGMGMGIVAGVSIGMAVAPKRKTSGEKVIGKALRTASELADNISNIIHG